MPPSKKKVAKTEIANIPAVETPVVAVSKGRVIEIVGARTHNLQNVSVDIPRNQLVVVTGVSGSGKSSLTIDTLYAEGQRRYVESMSSYARQFLSRMKKPEVDYIRGICPAIAIEQRVSGGNNRSTVGSMTEVADYLRMLFARVGETISPVSGQVVKRHQVADAVDYIRQQPNESRWMIFMPVNKNYGERTLEAELSLLLQKGYTRLWYNNELRTVEELQEDTTFDKTPTLNSLASDDLLVLIDRFVVDHGDEDNWKRLADSVGTAFAESGGECIIQDYATGERKSFNNRFELDGIRFMVPSPQLFNYNNSYGACPVCEGYGKVIGLSEDKIIPDKRKSLYEGAVAPWNASYKPEWLDPFLAKAQAFDFPIHKPYQDLTKAERDLLWTGNKRLRGIDAFFSDIESALYKIQNRILLARYRGRTTCRACQGSRMREEASYIKIANTTIGDWLEKPVSDLLHFVNNIELSSYQLEIGQRLLKEIQLRLGFMVQVGLGYLNLQRVSSTLSGGETQRIHLTRILGSNLTSALYLLDEPSVGLHPRDSLRLVEVLRSLRDLGNTVVVVEHEEDMIRNADYLIDMGPLAGIHGGHLIYAGPYSDIAEKAPDSLTVGYMTGRLQIPVPASRRPMRNRITLKGARLHNLKNVDITIPLNALTVVSGVSGSGKTTLIKQVFYPALCKSLGLPIPIGGGENSEEPTFDSIEGDLSMLKLVEMIGQQSMGSSSRSNPITYVGAYDSIRDLMANQPQSKILGYKAGSFSFNVEGGRCETCKGDGQIVVEMQFMADVSLECEECKGKRFKNDLLSIEYNNKNISDILELSVDEALEFFADKKNIVQAIQPLSDVGLGYIKLGQPASTLSGGEGQRLKLASFLGKDGGKLPRLFIFDEPTTGLHFHDVKKLLEAMQSLVEKGHTVLIIEHNLDVIKSADYLIDVGPEGGDMGGHVLYQGVPEGLVKIADSHTGRFLKDKL